MLNLRTRLAAALEGEGTEVLPYDADAIDPVGLDHTDEIADLDEGIRALDPIAEFVESQRGQVLEPVTAELLEIAVENIARVSNIQYTYESFRANSVFHTAVALGSLHQYKRALEERCSELKASALS